MNSNYQTNLSVTLGKFLFFVLIFFYSLDLYSQPNVRFFEGTLRYDVKVKSKTNVKFEQLFARHMTLFVKENRVLCRFDSSGVDSLRLGDLLINGDSNAVYRILSDQKLIQRKKLSAPHVTELVYSPEVYTPLNRKIRICGYLCELFTTEINLPMSGGKARVTVACAEELHFPVKGSLIEQATILMLGNGLKGIPLQKTINFEELETVVTITATDIKGFELPEKLFEIPQRIRIETFDRSYPY